MNKITRAERILQQMTDSGKLSENGREWLIAALDPMHDTILPHLSGWPDVCDAASVVRCHKESIQISRPSDITGNWDCVIHSNPILNSTSVCNVTHENNTILWDTNYTANTKLAPVTVSIYKAGDPYLTNTNNLRQQTVEIPNSILRGAGRLLGMGFESNNTTAELYKQGTCTAYRQPQHDRTIEVLNYGDVNASSYLTHAHPAQVFRNHPASLKAAMSLAGSRQWPAAEGCYSVAPFLSARNPVVQPTYAQPLSVTDYSGFNTDFSTGAVASNWFTTFPDYLGPYSYPVYLAHSYAPIHSTGHIFSGLSAESTITLTVNFYYEYFPDSSDSVLVSLATPSGGYDPVALELYSRALHSLPVGVPAGMNGMGDWFAGVVSEFAPSIADAIGTVVPGFGIVGKGMKAVADSYLASQSPQSRPNLKQRKRKPKNSGKKNQLVQTKLTNLPRATNTSQGRKRK